MNNMFYKHKRPEATKCYIQLINSYNQQDVMFNNIMYSHAKHESCKDLECRHFLFWGMSNEDKAELSPKSSQIFCLQHIIEKS